MEEDSVCYGCKYNTDEWHDSETGPCETCWKSGEYGQIVPRNYEYVQTLSMPTGKLF